MNFERIEELAKQAQNMIETQLDCKLDVEIAFYTALKQTQKLPGSFVNG